MQIVKYWIEGLTEFYKEIEGWLERNSLELILTYRLFLFTMGFIVYSTMKMYKSFYDQVMSQVNYGYNDTLLFSQPIVLDLYDYNLFHFFIMVVGITIHYHFRTYLPNKPN